ncbi:hypothetical protein [Prochlorococcus sp. MIT 1303]|uniref:OB-fold protein n=1 Tax=Prochlorococcus sp. MIT 1303 TaxID=1723647 RepID=UPI0007B36AE2|nr:hypothetical protein [Prochlorococcus sp. MIT 1303]KZR70217.1 tRNA_anti-like protein [Prochlorococcus sp. MIT 1303]
MKTVVGILTAGSLLLTAGCAELQKIAEEYKAEQAAEEANRNRIRTLDLDQPVASLSVEAIAEEFDANSVMAENKYMNQPVELSGSIASIDDSLFDEKNVSITITGGEYSFSSVSCTKPRNAPEVRELRKGMRVAVRGVVTSEEMGVGLSRCKFWLFSEDRWIGGNQKKTEEKSQTQQTTKAQSLQRSFNNHQEESTDRKDNNEIEQGKTRFDSSTTIDAAIYMIQEWVDAMSNNDTQRASKYMTGAAERMYDPEFFRQFERVNVSNLNVDSVSGSFINLSGIMTFVYPDGSVQKETRTFTIYSKDGSTVVTNTEFGKVVDPRN